MRSDKLPILILALALAGCSGAYDRELLGDPEPAPVPVAAVQAGDDYAEAPESVETDEPLQHTPSDYDMFSELGPYGEWYDTPQYGVVWQPVVSVGWQPFTYGHWIWTSYGWMWVSYEPFGWATYHYGNWWLDPVLGWIWIPSYAWAPCPVDWFMAGDYIGWAPLPPPGCTWDDPWVDQGRYRDGWVITEKVKFKEVDVGESRVKPERFKSAYRAGTAVRDAPDTQTIERATRQSVKETNIRFDTERFGTHERRKVVLPSGEQQIVERFPMPGPAPMPVTTPLPVHGVERGNVAPPPGKSKGTTPPPAATKDAPAKFKSKDSKGSSGTSRAKGGAKDDNKDSGGKAKGSDDSKDSGKSGGDKKDNGGSSSPSKAKGKKG